MTHKKGNTVYICEEPDDVCELCGKIDELRPYGPNGERICHECGMKDPASVELHMDKLFGGPPIRKLTVRIKGGN